MKQVKPIKEKIKCECCKKMFKGLWKDYRTIDGITSKVYSCGRCRTLSDLEYYKQTRLLK